MHAADSVPLAVHAMCRRSVRQLRRSFPHSRALLLISDRADLAQVAAPVEQRVRMYAWWPVRAAAAVLVVGVPLGSAATVLGSSSPNGALLVGYGLLAVAAVVVGARGLLLGAVATEAMLKVRNPLSTVCVAAGQIRDLSFRARPGAYGLSEWVGYVELEGTVGVWLWAAEAGRATRPPRPQPADAGLQRLRAVLGPDPRPEPSAPLALTRTDAPIGAIPVALTLPPESLKSLGSYERNPRSNRQAPITENWTAPLWNRSIVFLFALACFAGEWGLRRWKGTWAGVAAASCR